MEKSLILGFLLLLTSFANAQFPHQRVQTTFDNMLLSKSDTFNNGADNSAGLSHYGRFFNNEYDTAFGGSWNGWALSNMTDDSTEGFGNQYSSITGSGVDATPNYVVGYKEPYIKFDSAIDLTGAYFTNSTYVYNDMLNGSGFSKKFGGASGSDPDYFKVYITVFLEGTPSAQTSFYLADFRNSDDSKDYIVDDWIYVDFNNIIDKNVKGDSIVFVFESSDNGQWGMNTPAYFCMDELNTLSNLLEFPQFGEFPEDTFDNGSDNAGGFVVNHLFFPNSYNQQWSSWSGWSTSSKYDDSTEGFGNQYSAMMTIPATIPESPWVYHNYHFVNSAVNNEIRTPYDIDGQSDLIFGLVAAPTPVSFEITNSTYAYYDMLNGSGFSKKFGGTSGNDPDFLRVLVRSEARNGDVLATDTIYLADFRFADNSKDYILKDWKRVTKVSCDKLTFEMQSSDNGMWGMNTPAYFCLSLSQEIPGSIDDKLLTKFETYPNPTTGDVTIQANNTIENVQVFGIDGRLVKEIAPNALLSSIRINLKDQQSGVYFVQIETAYGFSTKKIIKQ